MAASIRLCSRGTAATTTITINDGGTPDDFSDDVVTVTDSVLGRDGTDRLTHIERLQFADLSTVSRRANTPCRKAR